MTNQVLSLYVVGYAVKCSRRAILVLFDVQREAFCKVLETGMLAIGLVIEESKRPTTTCAQSAVQRAAELNGNGSSDVCPTG